MIPTFSRPDLVCRAVRTALAQTGVDLEVIVVIDGDDPATRTALADIGDPRLNVINHESNRGAGEARNTGADAARADWVAFLDDDDEWLPTKLAAQLACAPEEAAVVMTLSKCLASYGSFIRPSLPYAEDMPIDEWLFGRHSWTKGGQSFLQCSSLMMPRSLFSKVRFTTLKLHEDWEIVLRAVKDHGFRLVTVREPLTVFHIPEKRPSLSQTFTWKPSLDWALEVGDLLTPKAFSGFCLTVVARTAAGAGHWEAFPVLSREAFSRGRPTLQQLWAFGFFRLSPERFRRGLRVLMQGAGASR